MPDSIRGAKKGTVPFLKLEIWSKWDFPSGFKGKQKLPYCVEIHMGGNRWWPKEVKWLPADSPKKMEILIWQPQEMKSAKSDVNFSSVQFSSVTQSCLTLCDPMNHSTPGLAVHHHLSEFTQTYIHRVCDAIQPSHPWSSPSPPAPNPSQHHSLFQWVNSSYEVAKVLKLQL